MKRYYCKYSHWVREDIVLIDAVSVIDALEKLAYLFHPVLRYWQSIKTRDSWSSVSGIDIKVGLFKYVEIREVTS